MPGICYFLNIILIRKQDYIILPRNKLRTYSCKLVVFCSVESCFVSVESCIQPFIHTNDLCNWLLHQVISKFRINTNSQIGWILYRVRNIFIMFTKRSLSTNNSTSPFCHLFMPTGRNISSDLPTQQPINPSYTQTQNKLLCGDSPVNGR